VFSYVTASIPHLIPFEVGNLIETLRRFRFLATGRHWASIAAMKIKAVIHMAVEVSRSMKPRTRANEDPARKPLRAVVTVWGALVRRNVIVAVRTHRRLSDLDAYLSLRCGRASQEAESGNYRDRKIPESVHELFSFSPRLSFACEVSAVWCPSSILGCPNAAYPEVTNNAAFLTSGLVER
jgi:hypothetical protein